MENGNALMSLGRSELCKALQGRQAQLLCVFMCATGLQSPVISPPQAAQAVFAFVHKASPHVFPHTEVYACFNI